MRITQFGTLAAVALLTASCSALPVSMPSLPQFGLTQSASMFLGRARVEAPENFCIDRSSSQLLTGFAIIVPCVALDDEEDFPPHPAFVTVQLDAQGTAMVAGTEEFLRDLLSERPEAILTEVNSLRVLETDIGDRAVAIHYRTDDDARTEGLSNDVWRAFADVDGRLATVSLRGYEASPLTVDDGRSLLYDMLELLREAN